MAQVDVIMPVYNTPVAFVRSALESVRAQSFTDFRAIILNDGSDAATSGALESLIAELNDSRLVYKYAANRGVSGARNAAMALSDSPFIAFLDSDDGWYPHKLQIQLKTFDERPSLALVHARTDRLLPNETILPNTQDWSPLNALAQHELIARILIGNFVSMSTVVVRRAAVENVGGFDDTLRAIEDKDVWVRLVLRGAAFWFINESVGFYRLHAGNSSKDTARMTAARLQLIQKVDAALSGDPEWKDVDWPALKRKMTRHTYKEAFEGYVESRQPVSALVCGVRALLAV